MLLLLWSAFGVFSQLAFVRLFCTTAGETTYYSNIFFIIAIFSMSCGFFARKLSKFFYLIPFGIFLNYALALWLSTHNLLQHLPGEFQWAPFANTQPKEANFDLQLAVLILCSSLAPIMVLAGSRQGECMIAGDYRTRGYVVMAIGGILGALTFVIQNQNSPSQLALIALWSIGFAGIFWCEIASQPMARATLGPRTPTVVLPILALLLIAGIFSSRHYWSPYQRITTRDNSANATVELYTNGFYISSIYLRTADALNHGTDYYRLQSAPFQWLHINDRALVLGSGGGTSDVREALYHGAKHVTAVEIDPEFVTLGTEHDPEHAYRSPRVTTHINDARRFLNTTHDTFDFVIMPFLDSQTNASNQSRFRLDSFLYTREGLALAYSKLSPDGIFFVSFATGTPWIRQRMFNVLQDATHAKVRLFALPNAAQSYYVVSHGRVFAGFPAPFKEMTESFASRPTEIITTDDWPFLYSQTKSIPNEHLRLIYVLCIFMACIFMVCRDFASDKQRTLRTAPIGLCIYAFFSGGAFFFIQIRTISALTPWFGSTYMSQAMVVMAIIVVSLTGALFASRYPLLATNIVWALLFCMIGLGFFAHGLFHPLVGRYPSPLLFALLLLLPTVLAGYLYLRYLEGLSSEAVLAMQLWNLVGGALGGLAEGAVILTGFQRSLWLVASFYFLALVAAQFKAWISAQRHESTLFEGIVATNK